MAGFGPVGSMPIASVPLRGSEPAVPASDLPPIGGNPAARTATRIAAEYDHYRNTPLPARAAYAPPSPPEQVVQPLQSVDEDKFFSLSAQLMTWTLPLCAARGPNIFGSSKTATSYYRWPHYLARWRGPKSQDSTVIAKAGMTPTQLRPTESNANFCGFSPRDSNN
jgi:hypothetical protein